MLRYPIVVCGGSAPQSIAARSTVSLLMVKYVGTSPNQLLPATYVGFQHEFSCFIVDEDKIHDLCM